MKRIVESYTDFVNNINENKLDIEIYKHGRCELFAYALHVTLGYDLYFFNDLDGEIYDYDGEFSHNEEVLIHAYCKDGNKYYDASGTITLYDIEENHSDYVNEPTHVLVNDKFNEYIKNGFIMEYNQNELSQLIEYIKHNLDKYTDKVYRISINK